MTKEKLTVGAIRWELKKKRKQMHSFFVGLLGVLTCACVDGCLVLEADRAVDPFSTFFGWLYIAVFACFSCPHNRYGQTKRHFKTPHLCR